MGGRGAFDPNKGKTGGVPLEKRGFSEVDRIGNIKVIQCDVEKNNPTTTFSNTRNTTYFAYSKERKEIEHVYYFRNHRLVKSMDFGKGEKPHTHYWGLNGMVGRKRHDKKNIFSLSDRDTRLMKKAQEYNTKKKKENG